METEHTATPRRMHSTFSRESTAGERAISPRQAQPGNGGRRTQRRRGASRSPGCLPFPMILIVMVTAAGGEPSGLHDASPPWLRFGIPAVLVGNETRSKLMRLWDFFPWTELLVWDPRSIRLAIAALTFSGPAAVGFVNWQYCPVLGGQGDALGTNRGGETGGFWQVIPTTADEERRGGWGDRRDVSSAPHCIRRHQLDGSLATGLGRIGFPWGDRRQPSITRAESTDRT
jgi:hypothetical protein